MCRFLCYAGREILLSELLYQPENSLIKQSYHARERKEPLNGDGFGVGWYVPEISSTPCPFTSVTPAWSNINLKNIAEHVRSRLFFAHVRAATPSMPVSEANCHPFSHGRYLWMHNGHISGFQRMKRKLQQLLPEPLYLQIAGTTDSEHAFALFLSLLADPEEEISAHRLGQSLARTVLCLERMRREARVEEPSFCNFAVTDGRAMAAIRYVSDPLLEPISLYFSAGLKYSCSDGICRLVEAPRAQ
ncbi:MAG: class II glutamine amidotransferase, partial [Acidobacteriota bacterium]